MSSSLGSSCSTCSSWRWSLSSSPERRAPRSRPVDLSLLRRSRSLSSASPGIVEEPQKRGDGRSQLVAGYHAVDMAEAVVRLRKAEVVGELLACRLLDDARAGERHKRAGLGDEHVAETGEAGE